MGRMIDVKQGTVAAVRAVVVTPVLHLRAHPPRKPRVECVERRTHEERGHVDAVEVGAPVPAREPSRQGQHSPTGSCQAC